MTNPVLSICVQTYNRREMVARLVDAILDSDEDFELLVHIDGSSDGTLEALRGIPDHRLVLTASENRGKAWGVYESIKRARGRYAMVFDDDDKLDMRGISTILKYCRAGVEERCCGFIFHFETEDGDVVGSRFNVGRSNFIALRADQRVLGDKKEVVLTDLFKAALIRPPRGVRRMPMSVIWGKLALHYDVICVEKAVAIKRYLPGGTTAKIRSVKFREPELIFRANFQSVTGFFRGRFANPGHLAKSLAGMLFYGTAVLLKRLLRFLDPSRLAAALDPKPQ